MDVAWGIVGVVFALLIGVGVSVLGLSPPEYNVARACFWLSGIVLGATTFAWELKTQQPALWRLSAGIAVWVCIGVGLPETLRWVRSRQSTVLQVANSTAPSTPLAGYKAPTPPLKLQPQGATKVSPNHRHPVQGTSLKPIRYSAFSNKELGHEITRVCASITVIAKRQQVQMDDISEVMQRGQAGDPRSGDPTTSTLRTMWFEKSDAFTSEVRDQYFPELKPLREEALRRLSGKITEDPNEKRLWDAMVSYLESPPSPVSAVHLQEYARYLAKMGDSVAAL